MKKAISILMVLVMGIVMTFALSACSDKTTESPAGSNSNTPNSSSQNSSDSNLQNPSDDSSRPVNEDAKALVVYFSVPDNRDNSYVEVNGERLGNTQYAIQLPNTKIKVLQRLLSQAIDEYKKVNRIMGMEFSDRLKRVVDEYNNRRRDEAFANEVLDDVAEQLAKLLEELKKEKDSFKGMGIDYEEKAFYDILKAVAKKYEFEYPDDKMIELSKRIKIIVDDKAKYTDWSTRDDIKANLQVDLILLLDEFDYPPVTIDDVYKEVLEQAENFKKYAG